jgi:hypothetical protein
MSTLDYTDKNLYGSGGVPRAEDIDQGGLGDCYYLAPLDALASQQPQTIQNAIRYDASDRSFHVTLYREGRHHEPEPVTVAVTQGDLQSDRAIGVDSKGYWHGPGPAPLWPEVMEAAYAKLEATRPEEPIGDELNHIGRGGWPRDAIFALTGQHDTRLPAAEMHDPDKTYARLHEALQEDRVMVLITNPMREMPHDGLVKGEWDNKDPARRSGHAYVVEAVYKDAQGEVMLKLRNPWGTNKAQKYGVNSDSPIVDVKLTTILDNGHLQGVDIGPAPAQVHEQTRQIDKQPHQSALPDQSAEIGDPWLDRIYAAAVKGDEAAIGQAMADLANSPYGQAFRAEGRAQYAEMQNQQLQRQWEEQQQQMQAQQQVRQGPVLSR